MTQKSKASKWQPQILGYGDRKQGGLQIYEICFGNVEILYSIVYSQGEI